MMASNDISSLRQRRQAIHHPELKISQDIQVNTSDLDTSTPLLIKKEPGFLSKMWEYTKSTTRAFTLSNIVIGSAAGFSAVSTGIMGLVSRSGAKAEDIGPEWWNGMSTVEKALSIINFTASFTTNAVMNALFLPTGIKKLLASLKDLYQEPTLRKILDNSFFLLIAITAGISAGAIGYVTCQWIPPKGSIHAEIASITSAIIGSAVTFTSRYLGFKNIFNRLYNLFNSDARAQAQCADDLHHLNPAYRATIENEFEVILDRNCANRDDLQTDLTEDEMKEIITELLQHLTEFAALHPDCITEKTSSEYAKEYASALFDLLAGIIIGGLPSFPPQVQAGYNGMKKITDAAGYDLQKIALSFKLLIGSPSAIATSVMYTEAWMKLRTTLIELIKEAYLHPKKIPLIAISLTFAVISSSGPYGLAKNMTKKIGNITGFEPSNSTLAIANAVCGGGVNVEMVIRKIFSKGTPDPLNVTLDDVIKYLEKVDEHPVYKDTSTQFKLFLKQASINEKSREPETLCPSDNQATIYV